MQLRNGYESHEKEEWEPHRIHEASEFVQSVTAVGHSIRVLLISV